MSDEVLEITADNWESEVIQADTPVVVDFWAEWCQPCKKLTPIVEEVAKDYAGKVKFGKFDIEKDRGIPSRLGVMGVPSLIFFKDGEEVDRSVGLVPRDAIEGKLSTVLEG